MKIQPETQQLINLANVYRKKRADLKGGYVIISNLKIIGWSLNIKDFQNKYMAGTWAIDESGNKYLAIGGNDYDGAEQWQMIPHDTFEFENPKREN